MRSLRYRILNRRFIHALFFTVALLATRNVCSSEIEIPQRPKHTGSTQLISSQAIGSDFEGYPWISHVSSIDLDQNETPEILICDAKNDTVSWLALQENGQWLETILASELRAPVHAYPADLDGDGDLDLLVASMSFIYPNNQKIGTVFALENDGSQNFTTRILLENTARVTDAKAADFDGDGHLDIALAQFGNDQGEVRWMRRVGPWEYQSETLSSLSGAINVCVADFDQNGSPDIAALISQQWEEIHLFSNDGSGEFSTSILFGSTNEDFAVSGMRKCDLNQDGRPDLLFTNGDGFGPTANPGPRPWHGVQWLENKGDNQFHHHRIGDLAGAYSPIEIDLDLDGDHDVVAVSSFNNWNQDSAEALKSFINDGSQNFTPKVLAYKPTHLLTLDAADFDGDGSPSLVTGAFHAWPPYDKLSRLSLWDTKRLQDPAATPSSIDAPSPILGVLKAKIEAAEQTIRNDASPLFGLKNLAQLYHANGYNREAILCYEQLLNLEPAKASWPHLLSNIHSSFGRNEEAIVLLKQAKHRDPNNPTLLIRLGNALLKTNQIAEATAVFESGVSIAPKNPHLLVGLARAHIALEEWNQALIHLERADVSSQSRIGNDLYAAVHERLGNRQLAHDIKSRAQGHGEFYELPDELMINLYTNFCYDSYRIALAAGSLNHFQENERAIALMLRAISIDPKNPDLHFQLALIYTDKNRAKEAREALQTTVDLKPKFAEAWATLSNLYRIIGDTQGADRILMQGIQANPLDPGLALGKARRLVQLGRNRDAIEAFEYSLTLHVEEAEPYLELSQLYLKANQTEPARITLLKGLNADPSNSKILQGLTLVALKQNDAIQAKQWIRKLKALPRPPSELIEKLEDSLNLSF